MFSLPEAARHFGIPLYEPDPSKNSQGASIDTRTLRPGDCFFALSGAQSDGHSFLQQAFESGASGAVISQDYYKRQLQGKPVPAGFKNILAVPDTSRTLADMAGWHRSHFSIPFIGITGSVGKTSTKEFLSYLLRSQCREGEVLSTRGNLNNHLGLPLTLLELKETHRFCVAEMGANALTDIAFLCGILKPSAGILTCVAPVHLEGFGSLENIYRTKTDLFRALPEGAPAVTLYGDSVLENEFKTLNRKFLRGGFDACSEGAISEVSVEDHWVSFTFQKKHRFSFPGVASFLCLNAAMALLMVKALGIALEQLPSRWEGFALPEGRFSVREIGGVKVIYDGYNASPKSFDAALETFSKIPCAGRRIVVFSDMRELGKDSALYHRALGELLAERGMDAAFAYGQESLEAVESFEKKKPKGSVCGHFGGPEELAESLAGYLQSGDMLLLKASRSMKIEKVLQYLETKSPFASARA